MIFICQISCYFQHKLQIYIYITEKINASKAHNFFSNFSSTDSYTAANWKIIYYLR